MKPILLILAMLATCVDIKADERILIVPPQTYTDGKDYPEYIRYFNAEPWMTWTAHSQCSEYAVWLHRSRISAPHYTACIDPSELMMLRNW
jgi:hypothetical protein